MLTLSNEYFKRKSNAYQVSSKKRLSDSHVLRRNNYPKKSFVNIQFVVVVIGVSSAAGLFHSAKRRSCILFSFSPPSPFQPRATPLKCFITFHFVSVLFVTRACIALPCYQHLLFALLFQCPFSRIPFCGAYVTRTRTHTQRLQKKLLLHKRVATFSAGS